MLKVFNELLAKCLKKYFDNDCFIRDEKLSVYKKSLAGLRSFDLEPVAAPRGQVPGATSESAISPNEKSESRVITTIEEDFHETSDDVVAQEPVKTYV